MSKSKKYFSIENFKCQLVTNFRQDGENSIVEILHPNTKEVLESKTFETSEIQGDRIEFLLGVGVSLKSGISVETSLQVPAQAQTRRTGYKKK